MKKDTSRALIAHFVCGEAIPAENFYCSAGTHVCDAPAGMYWETSGKLNSEIGFRFSVSHPEKPHLCVFRYPDDKKRYIGVSDCLTYDLSTGISTGGVYPLSGEMKIVEMVFWPRRRTENVSFITMNEGDPAALASLEIYELASLSGEDLPSGANLRRLGIQFEDPCGKCLSLGAETYAQWRERLIAYMKASGQNELYYPVNWYHGPNFPSETQPADLYDVCLSPDRRQYCRATGHPFDWVEDFLTDFDRNGLFFSASFTLVRLGTLLQNMNTDEASVRAGKSQTYNNMRGDDRLQNAVNDWTIIYNARSLPALLERAAENGNKMAFRDITLAYGERMSDIGIGPMFNPIHPAVQGAVREYLCEFARRYGRHPSLRCISINVWHSSLLWFGSLNFGYDDYTVGLFERETGISLGVRGGGHRFSARKEILLRDHRERWIGWRCEKIAAFIRSLRDDLRAAAPGVRLALNFWNEMVKPSLLGELGENTQLYERASDAQFLREAGMDLRLLGALDGVEICVENNHQRDITNMFARGGKKAPLSRGYMYRDFDFMDDERTAAIKAAKHPTAFVFNCWEESWGNVTVHPAQPNDLAYNVTHWAEGAVPEIIYEQRSDKHLQEFWYDWQIVIVAAFPPEPYYMEYYARSLADYDAQGISSGGLYADTAHTRELRAFAEQYRLLPAVRFEDVAGSGDPLTVRSCFCGGKTYFYAVNKSPVKLCAEFTFAAETSLMRVGKTEKAVAFAETFAPFELKVYIAEGETAMRSFTVRANDARARLLEEAGAAALRDLQEFPAGLRGEEITRQKLRAALEKGCYAALYHLVTGYVVAKTQAVKKKARSSESNSRRKNSGVAKPRIGNI